MCADALRLFGHDERLSQGATISLLTLLSRFFDIECKFNNCQLKFKINRNVAISSFLIMYHIALGLDLESVTKAADVVVEYATNTEDEYT